MFRERERRSRCVNLVVPYGKYRSVFGDNWAVRAMHTHPHPKACPGAYLTPPASSQRSLCYLSIFESLFYLQKYRREPRGKLRVVTRREIACQEKFLKKLKLR